MTNYYADIFQAECMPVEFIPAEYFPGTEFIPDDFFPWHRTFFWISAEHGNCSNPAPVPGWTSCTGRCTSGSKFNKSTIFGAIYAPLWLIAYLKIYQMYPKFRLPWQGGLIYIFFFFFYFSVIFVSLFIQYFFEDDNN